MLVDGHEPRFIRGQAVDQRSNQHRERDRAVDVDAHGRHNALVGRIVSFARSAECATAG